MVVLSKRGGGGEEGQETECRNATQRNDALEILRRGWW